MLSELHIESLGVIDRLDLVFGDGLTALTGETGAGKTMLVEAISLLVGGRSDASMVRLGADEARVEGRFIVDDEEVVVARVIPADGRSRAYINGRLATASGLAELGQRSVDLHGQHAHQSLLTTAAQRRALDRFCGTDLSELRVARGRLTEIDAALAALGGDSRTRARELDLVRFQVGELDAANVTDPNEDQSLETEEDVLADAVAHRQAGMQALASLADDLGALDLLRSAVRDLDGRAPFTSLSDRLTAAIAELDDVATDLRAAAERVEEDPQRLDNVRRRRQELRDLRRKYGDTMADVVQFAEEARSRLAELEGYDERVQRLEVERHDAVAAERAAASAVGAVRRAGAAQLASEVQSRVRSLAMPHALIDVQVGAEEPGDDVTFLLAANPGAPSLPLARVASGGELARCMLALRLVLTEAPDTLVFDEVDAGIGGAAAQAVGDALAALGERHQVLVVTHLAQVAAAATRQVVVSKSVVEHSTTVAAAVVDGEQRIIEIARMLSGDDAQAARLHAADLLSRSTLRRQR